MYRSFISLNLFPLLLSLSGLSRSIYRLSRKGGEKNGKGKEKERKIQAWIMTNGVLIEEWTLDLEAFLSSSNVGFSRANDARRSLTRRVHDLFGSCIRFDWNSNKFVFDVSFEILQNYIPVFSIFLSREKKRKEFWKIHRYLLSNVSPWLHRSKLYNFCIFLSKMNGRMHREKRDLPPINLRVTRTIESSARQNKRVHSRLGVDRITIE